MNKTKTVARVFYGVMSESDPTIALLRFFSTDKEAEWLWSEKFRTSREHPERFLLKEGFYPLGDTLYVLE